MALIALQQRLSAFQTNQINALATIPIQHFRNTYY